MHQTPHAPRQHVASWSHQLPCHSNEESTYHSGVSMNATPWPPNLLEGHGDTQMVKVLFAFRTVCLFHSSLQQPMSQSHWVSQRCIRNLQNLPVFSKMRSSGLNLHSAYNLVHIYYRDEWKITFSNTSVHCEYFFNAIWAILHVKCLPLPWGVEPNTSSINPSKFQIWSEFQIYQVSYMSYAISANKLLTKSSSTSLASTVSIGVSSGGSVRSWYHSWLNSKRAPSC